MGKRGPAKTPTPILSMRGSHLARSRGKVQPEPPKESPSKPRGLSKAASLVWDQTVERLQIVGTLYSTDAAAIKRYAELTEQWDVAVSGDDVHKMLKLAPTLLRIEQEFGLTPSSRAGLTITPRKVDEDLEKVYFG